MRQKTTTEPVEFIYKILFKLNFTSSKHAKRKNLINIFFNHYISGWVLGLVWIGLLFALAWVISPSVRIGFKADPLLHAVLYLVPYYFLPTLFLSMLITLLWHIPYKFSLLHPSKSETQYLAAILGYKQWLQVLEQLELGTRLKMFAFNWARVLFIGTIASTIIWYFFVTSFSQISEPIELIIAGILGFIDFGFFGFFSAYFIFKAGLLIRIGLFLRGYSVQVQYAGFFVWNLWWTFWGVYLKYLSETLEANRAAPLPYTIRYYIGLLVLLFLSIVIHYFVNKYILIAKNNKAGTRIFLILLSLPLALLLLINLVLGIEYMLLGIFTYDFSTYISAILHPFAYAISAPSVGHWIPTEYWFNYIESTFKEDQPWAKYYFWTMLYSFQAIICIYIPYNLCRLLKEISFHYPVNKSS